MTFLKATIGCNRTQGDFKSNKCMLVIIWIKMIINYKWNNHRTESI